MGLFNCKIPIKISFQLNLNIDIVKLHNFKETQDDRKYIGSNVKFWTKDLKKNLKSDLKSPVEIIQFLSNWNIVIGKCQHFHETQYEIKFILDNLKFINCHAE